MLWVKCGNDWTNYSLLTSTKFCWFALMGNFGRTSYFARTRAWFHERFVNSQLASCDNYFWFQWPNRVSMHVAHTMHMPQWSALVVCAKWLPGLILCFIFILNLKEWRVFSFTRVGLWIHKPFVKWVSGARSTKDKVIEFGIRWYLSSL